MKNLEGKSSQMIAVSDDTFSVIKLKEQLHETCKNIIVFLKKSSIAPEEEIDDILFRFGGIEIKLNDYFLQNAVEELAGSNFSKI